MTNSTVTHAAFSVTVAMHRLVASFGGVLSWAACAILLVGFGGLPQARATDSTIVFDNTPNTNGLLGFTQMPYGAEVTLSGANRRITEIDLGVGRQGFPGTADFEVWFYANDGSGGQPGTMLWDSGLFRGLSLSGPPQKLPFSVPSVLVPDTFTWVTQISNSQGAVAAAVAMTEATGTTVGSFDTDWFGGPGKWTKDAAQNEARIYAVPVPEPSTLALCAVAAAGGLAVASRRAGRLSRPARSERRLEPDL